MGLIGYGFVIKTCKVNQNPAKLQIIIIPPCMKASQASMVRGRVPCFPALPSRDIGCLTPQVPGTLIALIPILGCVPQETNR
jgi:hypothetical protein